MKAPSDPASHFNFEHFCRSTVGNRLFYPKFTQNLPNNAIFYWVTNFA